MKLAQKEKNKASNKKSQNGLKRTMVVSISLLILICAAGLIVFSYLFAKNSLQDAISDSLGKLATESAQKVDQKIDTYFTELDVLASNAVFQNPSANISEIGDILNRDMTKTDTMSLFLLDSSGNTIYSTSGASGSFADREYYQAAVGGSNYISSPLISKSDGTMIIIIAVPVRSDSGQITGVLCATKDANALSDFIANITYGKSGYAYIINDSGTMVACGSSKDLVLQEMNVLDTSAGGDENGIAISQKMVAGESGTGVYSYEGRKQYLGYAPLENAQWSLAITAPSDEVFTSVGALGNIMMIIAVVAVLISIGVSYYLASSIANPINTVVGYAATMANGDFTTDISEKMIKRKDEIGNLAKAFMKMSNGLDKALCNIKTAAEQVAAGSHQVSDSSISLSQGATEQASSIEELSASIEEIAAQTKQNAENAKQANELSVQTKQNADAGNTQMQQMLGAMDEINTSSNNIFKIIKVIEDIAFQTNILALNAAVEAARAGQHGKGFAVVAEEVRNLAARSSQAAQETTEMIQDSIVKVEEGSNIAHMTSEALEEIVRQIDQVAALVEDIANASDEQSVGIGQINEGIMQISSVVESNSAVAEESAASSEELAGQAQLLKEEVEQFKLRNGNYKERSHGVPTEGKNNQRKIQQDSDSKY
ncbi:MAG: methyl-accepting chemotaxis protein [Anaerofustis sp.]